MNKEFKPEMIFACIIAVLIIIFGIINLGVGNIFIDYNINDKYYECLQKQNIEEYAFNGFEAIKHEKPEIQKQILEVNAYMMHLAELEKENSALGDAIAIQLLAEQSRSIADYDSLTLNKINAMMCSIDDKESRYYRFLEIIKQLKIINSKIKE